ncbi:hypothetical protein MMC07_008301 [Pseudocyphellaria aurata]|nr:hypothetical protein [Pseudocyphellaria aurata]
MHMVTGFAEACSPCTCLAGSLLQSMIPEDSDFFGVYAGSSKEPDTTITHGTLRFPNFVIESGWSESFPRLRADKDLWIHGGAGRVIILLLIKWSLLANGKVSGTVEVWSGDANGNDLLMQVESIFPGPPPHLAGAQALRFTRAQLFGNVVGATRNPAKSLRSTLTRLRSLATRALSKMGLQRA